MYHLTLTLNSAFVQHQKAYQNSSFQWAYLKYQKSWIFKLNTVRKSFGWDNNEFVLASAKNLGYYALELVDGEKMLNRMKFGSNGSV